MQLIAVIMAAPTRDIRNNEAKQLLDFGFANYGVFQSPAAELDPIAVKGGTSDSCKLTCGEMSAVLEKEKIAKITKRIESPESVKSPIQKGDVLGKIIFEYNGEMIGSTDICAAEDVPAIGFFGLFSRIVQGFCLS